MKELFDAIRAGDAGRVSALLDSDATLADASDPNGVPALAFAKYNRREEIATLLEQRGAKLDVFLAAMTGNAALIRDLAGQDPSVVKSFSRDGWTPLHLAAFFNQAEAATALIGAGADVNARSTNAMQNTPLHAAVAGQAIEVVRTLLERGAEPNARQHGGWAPIHGAAQNGDVEIAELLIAAGADIRARAENGQGAMDLALTHARQGIVELLEGYGAAE